MRIFLIDLIDIEEVEGGENIIALKLETKEFISEEIVTKYFEGTWEVKEVDGEWRLWDLDIEEVEEPEYSWFWE